MFFSSTHFILFSVHNLFWITISLIAGITFHYVAISYYFSLLLFILSIVLGLIDKEIRGYWLPLFLLIPFAFMAGQLLCYLQLKPQKEFQSLVVGKTCKIQGTITAIESLQQPRFKYRLTLDLKSIEIINVTTEVCNKIIYIYAYSIPEIMVSDVVEVNGVLFKEITNQSFKNYLAKEKIVGTIFVDTLACNLLKRPCVSCARTLFYWRKNNFDEIKAQLSHKTFVLFSSIFLGNRTTVKKQMDILKEKFKIWGTSHYLARSGLHLVIFIALWHFILSILPITYILKQIVLIILILIYTLLSWSSISFERALLMFLFYKLCLLHGKEIQYIHLVTLVTAFILCINPLQLFFLDFQLSFGLTFALAWFGLVHAHKKQAI